ncbi:MAG: SDR family oxidoreductase [Candidatus Latescibacteria bacterium]|nr:SDR family oxidoreductase [Candidatus Latescibacterota bacterium]
MDLKLQNKIVLITGGTNGLGLRTARTFAGEGCHVSVCSIDSEEIINKTVKELRSKKVMATGIQANVCNPEDAKKVVGHTVDQLGGIDILINNVGKRFGDSLFEATDEDWLKTFDNIVFQAIRMIKLVVPEMRKRGGGSIINIASVSGWLPQLAKGSQYGASKNSLIFLAEPLALELSHDNIRVNTVSPGSMISPDGVWEKWHKKNRGAYDEYVRTSFPMGRLGSPEEVADVIVFLASPRAHWINGRHIPVDGLQQPVPAPGYKNW